MLPDVKICPLRLHAVYHFMSSCKVSQTSALRVVFFGECGSGLRADTAAGFNTILPGASNRLVPVHLYEIQQIGRRPSLVLDLPTSLPNGNQEARTALYAAPYSCTWRQHDHTLRILREKNIAVDARRSSL